MSNIYEELGLKRVINADGKMTKLGVSIVDDSVLEVSNKAAQAFVVIDDLYKKAGEIISRYTGSDDSLPTCSASAGICLSVAGLIARDSKVLLHRLPNSEGLKNEVIIQKGHVVNYGAPIDMMIRLAGGKVIEAGSTNKCETAEIEELIIDNTIALFYVKSHHTVQKGMQNLETMIDIAHRHGLPVIVDAAAEEDLKKYIALGADLVVYSGSKAIESVTSGFVSGKREYIDYARRQYYGIGRAMKVGKEQILGLIKALDNYHKKDWAKEKERMAKLVDYLISKLKDLPSLEVSKAKDAVREIYRCRIKYKDALSLRNDLQNGKIAIYVRDHYVNEGIIDLDVRALNQDDCDVICERIKVLCQE